MTREICEQKVLSFFKVVKAGDIDQIKHYIENGIIAVNVKDAEGKTALSYAWSRCYFEIVDYLFLQGAEPALCISEEVYTLITEAKSNSEKKLTVIAQDQDKMPEIIMALLYSDGLEQIDFTNTKIGNKGAKQLSYVLRRNSSIYSLGLARCNIDMGGCRALADVLTNDRVITNVDLSCNNIGSAGIKALAEVLKINRVLQKLNVSENYLPNVGIKEFLDALAMNVTITEVGLLSMNDISDDQQSRFRDIMKSRGILPKIAKTDSEPVVMRQISDFNMAALCRQIDVAVSNLVNQLNSNANYGGNIDFALYNLHSEGIIETSNGSSFTDRHLNDDLANQCLFNAAIKGHVVAGQILNRKICFRIAELDHEAKLGSKTAKQELYSLYSQGMLLLPGISLNMPVYINSEQAELYQENTTKQAR